MVETEVLMQVVHQILFNLLVLTEQEEILTPYIQSQWLQVELSVSIGRCRIRIPHTIPSVIELTQRTIRLQLLVPQVLHL